MFWFAPSPPAVAPAVVKSEPPTLAGERDASINDVEKGVVGTLASAD